MALAETIRFGMSLPHRSLEVIEPTRVGAVARRAEEFGFEDLWVTENVADRAQCLDSLTVLAYAAALTSKIGLGVSVLVLPLQHPAEIAHRVATLDHLSGGRALLGVGIGAESRYRALQVPLEHRVTRFRESIELMKALWTEDEVTYHGAVYSVDGLSIGLKPVRQPHPPVWLGGAHPDNLRRCATIADGWMGAGSQSTAGFASSVPLLCEALEQEGRYPDGYPISKRLFMSVDDDPAVARAEVARWFSDVYHRPELTESAGIYGTPAQVLDQIEGIVALGATHVLLNPVARWEEQLEVLAPLVGLSA